MASTIWKTAKPLVRRYESSSDAVLMADDTIIHKPHTDENAIILWHYDHATGTSVKGANLLSLLLDSAGAGTEVSLPANAHLIEKPRAMSMLPLGRRSIAIPSRRTTSHGRCS